jgi:hypothetical protein
MGKEKKDKKHCRDDHFDCLDHKKCKKKCDCKKDKCHCKVKQFVKDCLCCEWTVPKGSQQTVFQTGGFKRIFGSGFISYDFGSADFITVKFFLDNKQVGSTITVFEDSCVTFTFTKFDKIVVSCPSHHGIHKDHHDECFDACEGEICITTRYPVK